MDFFDGDGAVIYCYYRYHFMNHWHFYYIWLSLLSIVYSSHPKDRNGDMIGI